MIRFQELYGQYEKSIDETVKIWSPPEDEIPPYDKIIVPLFKNNEKIHSIQQSLKEKSNESLEFIVESSKIIVEVENATQLMVEKNFKIGNYKKIGAKVADAGNKLDQLIEKQLNKLESEFVEIYEPLKKLKQNNNLEKVKRDQSKLANISSDYFILNKIFYERGLSNLSEKHPSNILINYRSNRKKHKKIEDNISTITKRYLSFDSSINISKELKQIRNETKVGSFGSRLSEDCKIYDYFEGSIKLKELNNEVKDALSNPNKYINTRKSIEKDIEEMRRKNESNFIFEDYNLYDVKKYKDNKTIFCKNEIRSYEILADILNKKIEKARGEGIVEKLSQYDELTKKSSQLDEENKRLREKNELLDREYNSAIQTLGSTKNKVNSLKNELDNKVNNYYSNKEKLQKEKDEIDKKYVVLERELSKVNDELKKLKLDFNELNEKRESELANKTYNYQNSTKHDGFKVVDGKIVDNAIGVTFEYTSFPLELHIMNLGDPKNLDYYELMDIIEGRKSKFKTWSERFNAFDDRLSNLGISSEGDIKYLKGVAEGIKKAVKSPEKTFDIKAANKSYKLINDMVEAYSI